MPIQSKNLFHESGKNWTWLSILSRAILGMLVVAVPAQAFQPGSATIGRKEMAIEFPSDAQWVNLKRPITMSHLRGKMVLLDFWTYCCINCMHILPVLKQAEDQFSNELVVVGVHTAKFETERDTENILEAVQRYEIHHPVLNDSQHVLWQKYGVTSWPSLILIDPEGNVVWRNAGEITYRELEKVLKRAVTLYGSKIKRQPIPLELYTPTASTSGLRYPGKVLVDAANDRLFIADSNHHRIVVSNTDGKWLQTIGHGTQGKRDGTFAQCQFNHPQGMALVGRDLLYVADTENHLIRKIDLASQTVTTVAGTGDQALTAFAGIPKGRVIPKKYYRKPMVTDLASPWDLWADSQHLYIAMAGPHQIWRMSLDEKGIGPYAGNGREDIVDGPLLPTMPFADGASSFAQPSGLASDGRLLFVADSEGSSIRAVPLDDKSSVQTVVGTSGLSNNRLFTFGDVDGSLAVAKLQHPLGVAYSSGKLFVADTYNNKIKSIDLTTREVSTLVGKKSSSPSDPILDEPAGISVGGGRLYIADTNHHEIKVVDLKSGNVSTLEIVGLSAPQSPGMSRPTIPADATLISQLDIQVPAQAVKIPILIKLELPQDWKLNEEAPMGFVAIWNLPDGSPTGEAVRQRVKPPVPNVSLELAIPSQPRSKLSLGLTYYYCRSDGSGVCLAKTILIEMVVQRDKSVASLESPSIVHVVQP